MKGEQIADLLVCNNDDDNAGTGPVRLEADGAPIHSGRLDVEHAAWRVRSGIALFNKRRQPPGGSGGPAENLVDRGLILVAGIPDAWVDQPTGDLRFLAAHQVQRADEAEDARRLDARNPAHVIEPDHDRAQAFAALLKNAPRIHPQHDAGEAV